MPRDHGRILCSIWSDADFRRLTADAQRLYMLILSQKTINNAGVIPLMVSKWAKGCEHTTVEDVQRALDELHDRRFVLCDEDTEEAFVRSFIRGDGILKQPNVLKNALKCVRSIDSLVLRREAAVELRRIGRKDTVAVAEEIDPGEPLANPSETLPEGISNPSGTLEPFANPSRTLREPRGEGEGEGVKVTTSDTHFLESSSLARAHAHTRVRTPDLVSDPLGRSVPADGWRIVRDEIDSKTAQTVKTALAIEAATLLHSGTPEADVREALRAWTRKPGFGPKILPHLLSDIQRSRDTPAYGKATEKALGWLEAGQQDTSESEFPELPA
ncbi:hypothetical protein [Hoyosella altamirensis]|uniref:hypothetical protein n=1 Tax=Hoyosella altamirensis TaxID=616997 RepID=UPI0007DB331A|nr:hypothetical protein [Hoyosella altamirensis]